MPASNWDALYENAYHHGIERLRAIPGVCCAFHSVIDGLIRLTPDLIEPLIEKDESLKEAALKGCNGDAPMEIHSPEDFMQGLFYSVSRGAAMQRMIRCRDTHHWVMETFGPGEYRLGGTAGNMARSLAPLGLPVTVYANPLTDELADLFGDYPNLNVVARNGEAFKTIPPKQAAKDEGIFAIHWIFEYNTDFVIHIDGKKVQPHRANRYIPSWNPVNNQFRMSVEFAQGFLYLLDSYTHLLFSGFHILSERYPDSSTCVDVIKPLSDYLSVVRDRSSKLKIHLEMASIASPMIRRAVSRDILPYVHSIGLNETELPLFLKPIDPHLEFELGDNPSAHDYCQAMAHILNAAPVERIHFHNLGYYISMERAPWTSPEASRDALLFAATMASARAQHGLFNQLEDVSKGLATPVEEKGVAELAQLAKKTGQPLMAETGIGKFGDYYVMMVPTRLVKNPLFTVGLGDTISSGAFLTA